MNFLFPYFVWYLKRLCMKVLFPRQSNTILTLLIPASPVSFYSYHSPRPPRYNFFLSFPPPSSVLFSSLLSPSVPSIIFFLSLPFPPKSFCSSPSLFTPASFSSSPSPHPQYHFVSLPPPLSPVSFFPLPLPLQYNFLSLPLSPSSVSFPSCSLPPCIVLFPSLPFSPSIVLFPSLPVSPSIVLFFSLLTPLSKVVNGANLFFFFDRHRAFAKEIRRGQEKNRWNEVSQKISTLLIALNHLTFNEACVAIYFDNIQMKTGFRQRRFTFLLLLISETCTWKYG